MPRVKGDTRRPWSWPGVGCLRPGAGVRSRRLRVLLPFLLLGALAIQPAVLGAFAGPSGPPETPFQGITDRPGAAPASAAAPRDSAEVRRDAERTVRAYLREVGGGGSIPARPGQRVPSHVIRSERARLIVELDRMAREIPGDDWLLGQRVAFRVKQGRREEAIRILNPCRASPWWCDALSGFLLQVQGDLSGAHDAFTRAVRNMPDEERCRWREPLEYLLYGGLASRYGRADCRERDELARRIWWLADPFQIQPWNDRRSEHYARLMGVFLYAQSRGTTRGRCPRSCATMPLLRGWPSWWWSREGPREYPDLPGYRFLPPPDVGLRPLESHAWDWDLIDDEFHERYDPPYGPIHDMDQQTAFLRRGDSLLVVAVTEMDRHILRGAWSLEVGMVLSRGPDDEAVVVTEVGDPERFVLEAWVPDDAYLVSVEAVAERAGAARARFGHRLSEATRSGLALSDPILFDWDDQVEEELRAVLPRMLGTSSVAPGRAVGVFWETYGVGPGDELQVSVAARPVDRGFFRRLGQALRILGDQDVMRFTWQESGQRDGIEGRTLRVDLSELEPGRYVVELRVGRPGEDPAVARRHLEVRAF